MDVRITGIADINRVLQEIAPNEAKNIMRATVQDLASGIAKDAISNSPADDGDLRRGIKAKRRKGDRNTVRSEVIANADGKSMHWRFREYGQGPDGREDAMFLRALEKGKTELAENYLRAFTEKLINRLARKAK